MIYRRISALLAGVATSIAISSAVASPVTAAALSVQDQVSKQLRDYPGGTQISSYEIAYSGGAVIMVFPDPVSGRVPTAADTRPSVSVAGTDAQVVPDATRYEHGCPYGNTVKWYCVYQDSNWGGRMLEFKDCTSSGYTNSLGTYGFGDTTSSWVNTRTTNSGRVTATDVFHAFLWNEVTSGHFVESSYVGVTANDRAWYLNCTT